MDDSQVYKYKVSVIVPALNEENNIASTIENIIGSFGRERCAGEIVVIDDGSTDRTRVIAESYAGKTDFISVIHHDRPMGIGASFWEGSQSSLGEIVVLIPGDAEVDSHEILRYLPLLDHVDMVIPFFFNKNVRSWTRRMISKIYKGVINLTFGLLLNYMNGTVMYRKCIFGDLVLESGGFFYQTELLIKAIRKGYLYAEVPCALQQRLGGESKALTLKSLFKVISGYLIAIRNVYILSEKGRTVQKDSATYKRYSDKS